MLQKFLPADPGHVDARIPDLETHDSRPVIPFLHGNAKGNASLMGKFYSVVAEADALQ